MSLSAVIITLAVGGVGWAGASFIGLALLDRAWHGEPEENPDQRWPFTQTLLLVGAVLGIAFGVLRLTLWR